MKIKKKIIKLNLKYMLFQMPRKVRSNPRNSIKNKKRSKIRKKTIKKSRVHPLLRRRRTNIYRRYSQKGGVDLSFVDSLNLNTSAVPPNYRPSSIWGWVQYAKTHGMTNADLAYAMYETGATQEMIADVQRITSQQQQHKQLMCSARDAVRASQMRRQARTAKKHELDDDTWEILEELAKEEGISAVMAYLRSEYTMSPCNHDIKKPFDTFLLDLHHHRHCW